MSASYGCDVSFCQWGCDYPQLVKAGVQFSWIKKFDWSSIHGFFVDKMHSTHEGGFRSAGAMTGDYAFFHTTPDPIEFADKFSAICAQDQLPPVLDVETLDNGKIPTTVGAKALVCLTRIKQNIGKTPILYSYVPYLAELGRQAPGLAAFPIWIAQYHDPPSPDHIPKLPAPFSQERLVCYQFTGKGRLPGCPTDIDRDVMVKPLEDVLIASQAA